MNEGKSIDEIGAVKDWNKKSPLTVAQWANIVERYADGETAASLAAEFGVATVTIKNRVRRR